LVVAGKSACEFAVNSCCMMIDVTRSERAAGADGTVVVLGGPLSPLGWQVGFVEHR
jgi:hypothetical protein